MIIKIEDFEKSIQEEIDQHLSILPNSTEDVSGVYYNDMYIGVTVPRHNIFPQRNEIHKDIHGVTFRGANETKELIRAKLQILDEERKALFHGYVK